MRLVLSRCAIRDWCPEDADALVRHADDYEIWRQVRDQFPHPYGREDAEQWIAHNASADPPLAYAVEVDGEAVGAIGVIPQDDIYRKSAELGYWLGRAYWGRGIMSEAVGAFARWALDAFDLERVYAGVFATNPASARVLEKAGFQFEGRLRRAVIKEGEVIDLLMYGRVRQ